MLGRQVAAVILAVVAACGSGGAWAQVPVPAGLDVRPRGEYFEAQGVSADHKSIGEVSFKFQNLEHRAPWCLFFVMLDEPVDLTQGYLRLRFAKVSDNLRVKIEVRDTRFLRSHSAYKRIKIAGGENREVRIDRAGPYDALLPGGWGRQVLWPHWERVRYVAVVVEGRYNTATEGELVLGGIDYVTGDGVSRGLNLWADRIFCDEYSPAVKQRQRAQRGEPDDEQPGAKHKLLEVERQEVVVDVKRDDPSSALFLSGQGYKIDAFSPVGIAGMTTVREEAHTIDGLLMSVTRQLRFPERAPGVTDTQIRRAALSEPVDVRGWAGQVIFDPAEAADAGWPRVTLTYEDVDVESDSSIRLDFRQQIHEAKLLWSTPYLGEGRRWLLTLEPAYQYWNVTSGSDDFARLFKHRGILSATLHDQWEQRQFFVLGYYGRSNHKDVDADESEYRLLAEWRQWYGSEQFAFSTLGVSFTQTEFEIGPGSLGAMDTNGPRDDHLHEFELFASLITELDTQGRWRWVGQASFNRTTADLLIFFPTGETDNVAFDFWDFETRVVHEVIPDVDLSLGLEHAVADEHAFDSLTLVGRLSFFNAGPVRGELAAEHTWYYNQDQDLSTLFLKLDFAR